MIDAAALFTENIYRPLVANKEDGHYLKVARFGSVIVTSAGFVCGTTMPSVVAATVHFISILPFLGVSFWIGIIWPKANRYGAWISTLGSAMVFFGAKHQGLSNAWASLASLSVGIGAMIAGSYIGAPEEPARMNRIFGYLHRPAGDGDLLSEAKIE
jgi:Na+/proline symporter